MLSIREKLETWVMGAMDYCIYLAMKELGYPQEEALKGMATIQRNQVHGSYRLGQVWLD